MRRVGELVGLVVWWCGGEWLCGGGFRGVFVERYFELPDIVVACGS